MRIRHYGLLANRHGTEHLAACRVALDAPTPAPREQKPSRPSSLACSGPMSTAAPTVAKDGCTRSELSPLSLGPPAHRSSDGPPEPNGQEPVFMRYRMNPCASPLRRCLPKPPHAALRLCPPLTLPRARSILPEQPNSRIHRGNLSHDRRAEPTATRLATPTGGIQSPRLIAFDPAVQFNRSYPPCCHTADKILSVRWFAS
jgi:hypothetical protein